MRLIRFRVRTLMLAVAAVALLMTGPTTALRWYHHRYRVQASMRMAEEYADMAASTEWASAYLRTRLAEFSSDSTKVGLIETHILRLEAQGRGLRELSVWSKGLTRKYRLAMMQPWKFTPADPPYRATGGIIRKPAW